MDVVGTPAKDRRDLLSVEDFQKPERTLPWCKVHQGIYKVLKIHHGQGKFGQSSVLKLESENGETFFAWGTPFMVYSIEILKRNLVFVARRDGELLIEHL